MKADSTLDERLAPLQKAAEDLNKIDFSKDKASPEATKALIAGAATMLLAWTESFVRLAHAAEVAAKATAALAELEIAQRKDRQA